MLPGTAPPISIQCVTLITGERDHAAAPVHEDRLDQADVAGVRAALVRDVGREDVALAHAVEAVLAQDALDLRPERAGEEREAVRLGDDLCVRVGDAAGEVEHLVDDRAHARAREHDAHLVGRRVQLLLDDLDRERVEAAGHARTLLNGGGRIPLGSPSMKRVVLLTYTPRELDEDAYAAFIREIDYPNFRQCPWIIDYSCWRTVESIQGKELFTHFDLMEVRDFADWPKIVAWPSVTREHRALDARVVEARAPSTRGRRRTSRSRSASATGAERASPAPSRAPARRWRRSRAGARRRSGARPA